MLVREEGGSTALGYGIAVPHVFHASMASLRVAVVKLQQGVDFAACDGEPVHTLICLAGPESERDAYLATLRHVAATARDKRWRSFILQSRSAAGVLEVLVEAASE